MRLRDLCDGIIADVDGCLGCAVVDLTTGLPLAMQVVPGTLLNAAALEVMSAAGADYFRGRAVWQLETAMSGGAATGFVQEIQTTTEDTYHFMSVVPEREDTLLILITDKAANLGLGWIAMRQALARVSEVDPGDLPVIPHAPEPAAEAPEAASLAWQTERPQGPPAVAPQPGVPQPEAAAPVYARPTAAGQPPFSGQGYSPTQDGGTGPAQQTEGQEMFPSRWRGGHGVRGQPTTH